MLILEYLFRMLPPMNRAPMRGRKPSKKLEIVNFVRSQIASGQWSPGERIPFRTWFFTKFSTTPNTVQKAFRILEDEGLVESRSGAKSFLTLTAETAARVRAELQQSDLAALVSAVKRSGSSFSSRMLSRTRFVSGTSAVGMR